jgi:hypothetical protein
MTALPPSLVPSPSITRQKERRYTHTNKIKSQRRHTAKGAINKDGHTRTHHTHARTHTHTHTHTHTYNHNHDNAHYLVYTLSFMNRNTCETS